ncbi:MAG TPA: UDP-N-acetylmuramoyl-L-alanine--D-glutamate ligase, partial [Spirochaetes bacterium]|nr:UDP-N-acetylmuramoyl-L-alanine--D-glutamate ligase [Spirochaetota bacterium]
MEFLGARLKSKVENFSVKNKKVLVVGLGFRTGLAAANFLVSAGARVTVSDVKPADELADVIARLDGGVRVMAGNQDPSLLDEGSDLVVLSPGVPATIPLVAEARHRRIPVIAEIELAYRFLKGKIIAITGTDGKSTTTSLTAHILGEMGHHSMAGGNIGIPLVSLVETARDNSISVVELSSFQLETVDTFRPDVAALLNVSPDHMDRYSGMEDYFAAKCRIAMNQKENDYFIYNKDDAMVRSSLAGIASCPLGFSLVDPGADAFIDGSALLLREGGKAKPVLDTANMRIVGVHNAMNTMAAVLMARSILRMMNEPVDMEALRSACYSFRGLEHRMEVLGEARGRIFINDSKATTVGAVTMALKSLP